MKKAQVPITVYFRIFELVLLVSAGVVVYTEIKDVQDSGVFQKKYLARDLALLLDSFGNAKGNLFYVYNPSKQTLFSQFNYEFEDGVARVDSEEYPFVMSGDLQYHPPGKIEKPGALVLQKTGNSVLIDSAKTSPEFNPFTLHCPAAPGVLIREVVLDPGHGFNEVTGQGEKGEQGSDASGKPIWESQFALRLASALSQQIALQGTMAVFSTRSLKAEYLSLATVKGGESFFAEEAKDMSERLAVISGHEGAAVVSLHVGKGLPAKNPVKVFVNSNAGPDSQRLACTVLNSIAKAFLPSITGTSVIPVDVERLPDRDPKKVLVPNRIAILVEVGNIAKTPNPLLEKPQELARAIAQGIQEYHGQ